MPVRQLLTGRPGPIDADEYYDWMALFNLEAKERKAAEDKAKRESKRGRRR